MLEEEDIQLKVRISKDVLQRLEQYVTTKYPDLLNGLLSNEIEKAIIQYLDYDNTHAHTHIQKQQGGEELESLKKEKGETKKMCSTTYFDSITTNNNSNLQNKKYNILIETIKLYSNKQKQISFGLVKKAIMKTLGKDPRTIDKYLKILQEEDILYSSSTTGMYDIQPWIFGDYNRQYSTNNNNNNNNKLSVQE